MTARRDLTCWVVTPGAAGMENQALGLADAMGLSPKTIRISVETPWVWVPPQARFLADRVLAHTTPTLAPPWPDLILACGRRAILPTIAAARAAGGRTRTVYLQDPRIGASAFDRVVVPAHDRLRGANVLVTAGALHRVTPERLAEAAEAPTAPLPPDGSGPVVAVLIGGRSKAFDLTDTDLSRLLAQLDRLQETSGARLLVTASRRTGRRATERLAAALDRPTVRFWSPEDPAAGPNPLFAFLHHAQAILVTGDSVSMLSEACSLGRPVGILRLTRRGPSARKIESFTRFLIDEGAAVRFEGAMPPAPVRVLNEPQRIAGEIWNYLDNSMP